jgi:hypothetical protein
LCARVLLQEAPGKMIEHLRRQLSESVDVVRLVVPPSSDYLRTVRLVAADAAVRAGHDCEEVEDVRIAVDELCHLLMSSTDDFLELRVVATEERVIVQGVARARSGSSARMPNEMSTLILASTTDFYDVGVDAGDVCFTVVKQARRVLADR